MLTDIRWDSDPRDITFYKEIKESTLTQEQLKVLRKSITHTINEKYSRGSRRPKYGRLSRAFLHEQLLLFFSHVNNPQHLAYYWIEFLAALRIGETNTYEVLWDQDVLKIMNDKVVGDRVDYLPLFEPLRSLLLFFRDKPLPTYSKRYLGKMFRKYRDRIPSLCYVYDTSSDGRGLHQFTSHSLRHTGINMFGRFKKDDFVVSLYSRHEGKEFKVLKTYYHYTDEELRADLESCFAAYVPLVQAFLSSYDENLIKHRDSYAY